jgi:hypothetical protein
MVEQQTLDRHKPLKWPGVRKNGQQKACAGDVVEEVD